MKLSITLPIEARRAIIAKMQMEHPVHLPFNVVVDTSGPDGDFFARELDNEIVVVVKKVVWDELAQICIVETEPKSADLLYFPLSQAEHATTSAITSLARRVAEDDDSSFHFYELTDAWPPRYAGVVRQEAETVAPEETAA